MIHEDSMQTDSLSSMTKHRAQLAPHPVLALALHRCGAAAVPIYDGAWCEYEASGLPVVVDAE